MRYRSRDIEYTFQRFEGGKVVQTLRYDYLHSFIKESRVPNGNRVTHYVGGPWTGFSHDFGNHRNFFINTPPNPTYFPQIFSAGSRLMVSWDRLPSSSRFGLLQFIAELDDTLALFTRKFWKSLSYGSFTWGVLPFVNDIKSILETIESLGVDLKSVPYEDSRKFVLEQPFVSNFGGYHVNVEERLQGTLSLSSISEARLWLDRLGFHPDIGTVWDLIPLSFVVDWILPVGDFLSHFYDRGWIKSVPVIGWHSVKFEGTCHFVTGTDGYLFSNKQPPIPIKGYKRDYVSSVLDVSSKEEIDFSLPSLRQLFNIFYIFVLSRKSKF